MATYAFETITASQARALLATDTLTFASGPSNQVTVLYDPTALVAAGGAITLVAGGRAVEFGAALAAVSQAGRLLVSDGSRLVVGDDSANTADAPTLAADDGIYGGGGDDTLQGGGGDDLLQGNAGRDYIVGGPGRDVIYGGQDNDRILCTAPAEPNVEFPRDTGGFAQGNKGNDTIEGTLGVDTLLGGQGNDVIAGFDGLDVLNGNLGDDELSGAGLLLGEAGNDRILGSGLADTLMGGDGDDRIYSRGGAVDGGDGADLIEIGVRGPGGNNTVHGGEGADTVTAQLASELTAVDLVFFGDAGNDSLVGSVLGDTLNGGDGADTLSTYGGGLDDPDVLSGGAGQDNFLILNRVSGGPIERLDTARIIDWQAGDRIDFLADGFTAGLATNYREMTAGSLAEARQAAADLRDQGVLYVASQVGNDVAIFGVSFPFHQASVILVGRTLADIAFENFS